MHMMGICLDANWVCACDRPLRLSEKCLRWIGAGQCGTVFGWKFPDGPRLRNIDRPMVGK